MRRQRIRPTCSKCGSAQVYFVSSGLCCYACRARIVPEDEYLTQEGYTCPVRIVAERIACRSGAVIGEALRRWLEGKPLDRLPSPNSRPGPKYVPGQAAFWDDVDEPERPLLD